VTVPSPLSEPLNIHTSRSEALVIQIRRCHEGRRENGCSNSESYSDCANQNQRERVLFGTVSAFTVSYSIPDSKCLVSNERH
jgi:hypothetical protein